MNGMNRMLRGMALAALAAASLLSQAAPVVSVNPASQTINIGDTASVDIIVSGLTDPTGGFSLTLDFNDSFLKAISYLNDPDAKMGAAPLDMSGGFSGGSLDLFFVADATETEASLAAAQGASFTLATISFEGLANGLSPLKLSNVVLSNWDGTETLAGVGTRNGEICVGGNCNNVPEPASMALAGAALGALALLRRRRSGAQSA
jgi:MYXO-CTERM domain-containing protein